MQHILTTHGVSAVKSTISNSLSSSLSGKSLFALWWTLLRNEDDDNEDDEYDEDDDEDDDEYENFSRASIA